MNSQEISASTSIGTQPNLQQNLAQVNQNELETQRLMIEQFSQQSGLNLEWSK
jgi:hypothetical protein